MISEREYQKSTKHSSSYVEEITDNSQPINTRYGLENYDHSTSIIFFGSGPVAAASLDFLSNHFSIEAVITKPVPAHHKGIAPVEELSRKLRIPILFANNKQDLDQVIANNKFQSRLGIVVDYGVIMSQTVIDSFELGIVNSHFSLLPEWRGADPITFSILSGQPKTGVSLMVINQELDTGKLIIQKDLGINSDETTPSLTKRLIELSNQLLLEFLPRYINNEITLYDQPNPDQATYSRKLTKADGIIDWQKPAEQIEREIRAYIGWPKSKTTIDDKTIVITKAHTTDKQDDKLDIICGDGDFLSIDELIAPSGRTMLAKDFINGYLLD